jgi:hypothetical protein
MDLTPGQQRLVFVVVVLALAGLGIYLLNGRGSGGTPAAAPQTTTAPPPAASSAAVTPAASTQAASVPPTAIPSATPASTAGGAAIYQWLPFSPAGLTAAATTTTAFAKAYATWSYKETATAYGATFNGLATDQEITTLEEGNSAPGLAQQRTAAKQASTGSGTINSIRSIVTVPSTSIMFLVTITDTVTSTQPATTKSTQYSVTLIPQGTGWLVNDIELSTLGNS